MGIQTASQAVSNDTGPNSSPFGFRNRLQNGEMTVNQRAVSNTTNTAANFHATFNLDRWQTYHYNVGGSFNPNLSIKRTADHPVKGTNGYCLEVQCNTTGTTANNIDFFTMTQSIEAQDIADVFSGTNAQPMTLSFWVKSNKTGTYCVQLRDNSGAGGYIFVAEYNIIQSGTWEKKTVSISKPTHSVMPTNNTNGLTVHFHYASGLGPTYNGSIANAINSWYNYGSTGVATNNQTNLFTANGNYHRLTDVQLEVGTIATPFERRPYSKELALCQRYLEVIRKGANETLIGIAYRYRDDYNMISYPYKVTKRTEPTVTFTGDSRDVQCLTVGGTWGQCTSVAFTSNINATRIIGFYSGTTLGNATEMRITNDYAGSYITISAEI